MRKIFIVMGTKGGAGKTHLVVEFLPLALLALTDKRDDLKIDIALIDSNNKQNFGFINNSNLKVVEKIKATNKYSVNQLTDVLMFNYRNIKSEDNHYLIIDVGGGDDTNIMIDAFSKTNIDDDAIFFVPFFINEEYIEGAINTIRKIRKKVPNAKIAAVAINREEVIEDEAEARGVPLKEVVKEHVNEFLKNRASDENYLFENIDAFLVLPDFSEACAYAKDGKVMFYDVFYVLMRSLTFKDEMKELDEEIDGEEITDSTRAKYKQKREMLLARYSFYDVFRALSKDFAKDLLDAIR